MVEFTLTVIVEGATPVVGLTDSQLPPDSVATLAVQPNAPAPVFRTSKVCAPGLKSLRVVNRSTAGLNEMVGVPKAKVTPTVCGLLEAPAEVTVIEPL